MKKKSSLTQFELAIVIFTLAIILYTLYRFASMFITVFSDNTASELKQEPVSTASGEGPVDHAKRWFNVNAVNSTHDKNGKIIITSKMRGTGDVINRNMQRVIDSLNENSDCFIAIETDDQYHHHVILELVFKLVELTDRQLDINKSKMNNGELEAKTYISKIFIKGV